jgi:hypothetical protein
MQATGAAAFDGHRTGCHACGEGNGHRAREKLFPHRNLLHPDRTPISASNQRKSYQHGLQRMRGGTGKIMIHYDGAATDAVHVGAMLEPGDSATM